jgi:chromosome partitioning related protein ParA
MKIAAVASTKGGVGKTTTSAGIGALCADAGLRTLLIDLDPVQPSLSSYYPLIEEAQGGIYDLLTSNVTDPQRIISETSIPNLSLILSNDINNQLTTLLLQAADGRLRLANLLPAFKDQFDLVLIDTQGARSAMLEMVILAADLVVSPLPPDMLAAREFSRGMLHMLEGLQAYSRLGLTIPTIHVVVNMLDNTNDAQQIYQAVQELFQERNDIRLLETAVPKAVVYRVASTHGTPAHRLEYRAPADRKAPAALTVFRKLAIELFPHWRERFEALTDDVVAQIVKEGR